MVTADLYVRVSTDEQAEKGYSQRNQDERLRKYCGNDNMLINKVIYRNHSTKSFECPEWKKYLLKIKKRAIKVVWLCSLNGIDLVIILVMPTK